MSTKTKPKNGSTGTTSDTTPQAPRSVGVEDITAYNHLFLVARRSTNQPIGPEAVEEALLRLRYTLFGIPGSAPLGAVQPGPAQEETEKAES